MTVHKDSNYAQLCTCKGWVHLHGSWPTCPDTLAQDPGLDHLLEEVAVEVLRQDAALAWTLTGPLAVEDRREHLIADAARALLLVRAIDQAAGGEQP